jgi:hypothetical protein
MTPKKLFGCGKKRHKASSSLLGGWRTDDVARHPCPPWLAPELTSSGFGAACPHIQARVLERDLAPPRAPLAGPPRRPRVRQGLPIFRHLVHHGARHVLPHVLRVKGGDAGPHVLLPVPPLQ